MFVTC
jgi:hypothetical protein